MIQDLLTQLHPVSQGALGAFIYGAMFFAYVRLDPDDPETFDPIKFGSTVLVGMVVGGVFGAAGIAPTYESVAFALTSYAGTVALTEAAIKALLNGNKRRAQDSALEALRVAFGTTVSKGRSREDLERELERGTAEYGETSNAERREEWDRRYPDPDTAAQLDDPADDDPENQYDDREGNALPPA